uniref:SFRICE_004428 n=1 Tax=Spodoptera frugiperda TaxID=7108 RepID=A0A2H1VF30_SPOFR
MTRCENTNKANKYCGIGNATIYHFTAQSRAAPRPPCGGITEIAKRLNAIIAQILPFLSQEHQQQVASAVERAKQVTMTELNAIIGTAATRSAAN